MRVGHLRGPERPHEVLHARQHRERRLLDVGTLRRRHLPHRQRAAADHEMTSQNSLRYLGTV